MPLPLPLPSPRSQVPSWRSRALTALAEDLDANADATARWGRLLDDATDSETGLAAQYIVDILERHWHALRDLQDVLRDDEAPPAR